MFYSRRFALALTSLLAAACALSQNVIRVDACRNEPIVLTAPPGFQVYDWRPTTGLDNSQSQRVTLTPTQNLTYAVTYEGTPGDNLVTNPGFEAGNVGFTSDYRYVPGGTTDQGSYAILTNPSNFNRGFTNCTDPAGGRSNMYIADGATVRGAKAWCQRVTVEPGRRYAFSLSVASLVTASPPQLAFTIGGQRVGTANLPRSTCLWRQFYTVWTAPADAGEVEICIVNDNETPDGNDFALDDISLVPLDPNGPQTTVFQVVVNEPKRIELDTLLCEGARYIANGLDLAPGESGTAQLTTTAGCDSVLTVRTALAPPILTSEFNTTSCRGAIVTFDGLALTRDTVITRLGTSTLGCDSTHVFTLRFFDRTALQTVVTPPTCPGEANASARLFILAGVAPYEIRWDNGQTDSILTDVTAGSYGVEVRDADGCVAQTEITIEDPVVVEITSLTPTPATCFGEASGSVAFETRGGTGELTAVAIAADGRRADPTRLAGGDYRLVVTDEEGCTASSAFNIASPPPTRLSLVGDTSVLLGQTARAVLSISGNVERTRWNYNLGPIDSLVDNDRLAFVPAFDGRLRVVGTDANGCDVEATLDIDVRDGRRLYFPSAFTPNGDDVNDAFGPVGSAAIASVPRMEIYDRWGGLVFASANCTDLSNDACSWDGRSRQSGELSDAGVFAYVAILELINGTFITDVGEVTLIR